MEKWTEIYREDQLKALQRAELEVLDELDRLCGQLGLTYFLYGGTLIGAVKYRGFVPWDDDVDAAMPRADYEKLLREGPGALSPDYFLQSPRTDRRSPYAYAKLRRRGTARVEYGVHRLPIEQGIYVDIYPVDRVPRDEAALRKAHKRFHTLARLYFYRQCPWLTRRGTDPLTTLKRAAVFLLSAGLKLIPRGFLLRRMDAAARRHENEPDARYGNYYHASPVNLFEQLEPWETGLFEGREVKLPRDWEGFLRTRYGDYRELPPEEKRIGHRPWLLDLGDAAPGGTAGGSARRNEEG